MHDIQIIKLLAKILRKINNTNSSDNYKKLSNKPKNKIDKSKIKILMRSNGDGNYKDYVFNFDD